MYKNELECKNELKNENEQKIKIKMNTTRTLTHGHGHGQGHGHGHGHGHGLPTAAKLYRAALYHTAALCLTTIPSV